MDRNRIGNLLLIVLTAAMLLACSNPTDYHSTSHALDSITHTDEIDSIDTALKQDTAEYDYESLFNLSTYLTDSTLLEDSIQVINSDCAVLIYPTSAQIDAMIKDNGEDNFYIIADDNNWYQGVAIGMIDSVGVKTIGATKPFLRFEGKEKRWTLAIRKKNLPEWNIVFFNTSKEPKIISAIELSVDQVQEYFNKP
jgi:hypothetical protein